MPHHDELHLRLGGEHPAVDMTGPAKIWAPGRSPIPGAGSFADRHARIPATAGADVYAAQTEVIEQAAARITLKANAQRTNPKATIALSGGSGQWCRGTGSSSKSSFTTAGPGSRSARPAPTRTAGSACATGSTGPRGPGHSRRACAQDRKDPLPRSREQNGWRSRLERSGRTDSDDGHRKGARRRSQQR